MSRLTNKLKVYHRWREYTDLKEIYHHSPNDRNGRDKPMNLKSKLPENESVEIPILWVVEFYSPSSINHLISGIQKLKWNSPPHNVHDIQEWMKKIRAGRVAGWVNLGPVRNPNNRTAPYDREAPLPASVEALYPTLFSLTPSLTVMVTGFKFTQHASRSLITPLTKDLETEVEFPFNSSKWSIIKYILFGDRTDFLAQWNSPFLRRKDLAESQFSQLEEICTGWMHHYFPGVFANLSKNNHPCGFLLTTEKYAPLSEESADIHAFKAINLSNDFNSWRTDSWPSLRMTFPNAFDNKPTRTIIAVCKSDAENNEKIPIHNYFIHRANEVIPSLLSRHSISILLDTYYAEISRLRDLSAQDKKYRVVRDLKNIRSLIRTILFDVSTCSRELTRFTDNPEDYNYDVLNLKYCRERGNSKRDLLSEIRLEQHERAKNIIEDANLTSSMLTESNTLTSSINSIRVQRLLVVLTMISICLASYKFVSECVDSNVTPARVLHEERSTEWYCCY